MTLEKRVETLERIKPPGGYLVAFEDDDNPGKYTVIDRGDNWTADEIEALAGQLDAVVIWVTYNREPPTD